MEIIVALAATVPVLVVVAVVLFAIRNDGYGHRPPPASREDWSAQTGDNRLPSRPYRQG